MPDLKAVASHGLFTTPEGGGSEDPIVLPSESDVRFGVMFGVNGTQYMGTAIVQPDVPPDPPNETTRRYNLNLQNDGWEFRFRLSNDMPDTPIEIHGIQVLYETTERV